MQNRLRRERYDQSILDFVMEDANTLNARLGISKKLAESILVEALPAPAV